MNADEAAELAADQVRTLTEWRELWMKHIALIGRDNTHLDGTVINAAAFAAAKEENPELYARSVMLEAGVAELHAQSAHAIAQSEVRWVEMEERAAERDKKNLPKGGEPTA